MIARNRHRFSSVQRRTRGERSRRTAVELNRRPPAAETERLVSAIQTAKSTIPTATLTSMRFSQPMAVRSGVTEVVVPERGNRTAAERLPTADGRAVINGQSVTGRPPFRGGSHSDRSDPPAAVVRSLPEQSPRPGSPLLGGHDRVSGRCDTARPLRVPDGQPGDDVTSLVDVIGRASVASHSQALSGLPGAPRPPAPPRPRPQERLYADRSKQPVWSGRR